MPTKVLAIYFSEPDVMGYPFDNPKYFSAYKDFVHKLENNNIKACVVRGDSYLGDGFFRDGWEFVRGEIRQIDQKIKADLILNRDDKGTIPHITDCPIINHPDFDKLCVDKLATFERFSDISPKTTCLDSYKDFVDTASHWQLQKSDMVVLKKNFETEGRGVYILPVKDIVFGLYDNWRGVIFQEFMDSSIGIPGIVDGMHDLRVHSISGKHVDPYLRTPQKGSYLANIAQGGSLAPLSIEEIPEEVLVMMNQIENSIKQYQPAIFAADFINSPQGYKLLELNSRPGLRYLDWCNFENSLNVAMIDSIVSVLK